jgi:tetratricopeptide (TPR) repeat protein
MASIVQGYEYDIFISYRQKDNKGDRWVSEFVEALKTELESTFKEEVSVYFDINPHDGLLETHEVDASLKEKLKCLVFVPIISRTYCDPKSFAWEHEFKAFVEQASGDKYGLKVKLPGGNVASRVLPVRIHDLDADDIKLTESLLGGFLRGVEFIYKSSGVNRPLRAREDKPHDNLNNTIYRDQINKVANAIKEIVSGLRTGEIVSDKEKEEHQMPWEEVKKRKRTDVREKPAVYKKRKLLSSVVAIVLIAALVLIYAYPKIFNPDALKKLRSSDGRISVAVMPFQNMTGDTTRNIWQNWIQDNLIAYLSNSEELRVRQIESVKSVIQSKGLTEYASITPSVASSISQTLDANVFIYGSISQTDTILRINTKLINSKTEEVIKSFQIDGTSGKILYLIDSLSLMVKNFLVQSKLEKETRFAYQHLATTNSPEAYRYFIFGNNAFSKGDMSSAVKLYHQALDIDSNLIFATLLLGYAYGNQGLNDEMGKCILLIYKKREMMSLRDRIWTNFAYSDFFGTPYEAIGYLRQLQEIDEQVPNFYFNIGGIYSNLHQYDKAIVELEKGLEIFNKWNSKPFWSMHYYALGLAYCKTGQYKKAQQVYEKAEQDFPDNYGTPYYQSILFLTEGDTLKANNSIKKFISLYQEISASDADISTGQAEIYAEANFNDKAEEYYRHALLLEPDNPTRIYNLAKFLIEKNRNIDEGLILVDKIIKSCQDKYSRFFYLDTKGWGLYKQGKNKEALKLLEQNWDLKPIYNYEIYLHLEEVTKAIASQKKN